MPKVEKLQGAEKLHKLYFTIAGAKVNNVFYATEICILVIKKFVSRSEKKFALVVSHIR